jgi:hypothetical protein
MLNLNKRVSKLLEKTSSVECKQVCKDTLGMYQSVPENQLTDALVEKLKNINDSDNHVKNFVNTSEKLRKIGELGIAKGIAKLKQTEGFHYPTLRYTLEKFERALISQQTAEFVLAEDFCNSLKNFTWDTNVVSVLEEVQKNVDGLREEILAAKSIGEFSRNSGNFMFEKIVDLLEQHFENPTESSRSILIENLTKFSFNATAKRLLEQLRKIQSTTGKVQMVSENANCEIIGVYSPILNEKGSDYFYVRGAFFKKTGDEISRMAKEETNNLSESFKKLCSIFDQPYFSVKENRAVFYLGRNKVEILENESDSQILFNGKNIAKKEIARNLISTGLLRLEEANAANEIQSFADNFGTVFNLDFATVIASKANENCFVNLMKSGDKIYIHKVNPLMGTDEFYNSLNGVQARNIVLEYLGYDITESLEEFIAKDEKLIREMKDTMRSTLEKINIVEGELGKVNSAIAKDAYLASNSEMVSLKSMLESENDILRKEYAKISEKVKMLENKTSESSFEAGDDVKIISTGETAKVSSVNSSTNRVTITTGEGKTKTVPVTDITSIEGEIEKAAATKAQPVSEAEGEDDEEFVAGEEEKEEKETLLNDIPEIPEEKPMKEEPAEEAPEDMEEPAEESPEETPEVPAEEKKTDPEFVKATVSADQDGPCAGKEVEVNATDFASKGAEEMVDIKCGEETYSVEKKFVNVLNNPAPAPAEDFSTAPGEVLPVSIEPMPTEEPMSSSMDAEDNFDVHDTEAMKAWLTKVSAKFEEIKDDMKDTFVSNDTVASIVTSLRGMLDALKADTGETVPQENVIPQDAFESRKAPNVDKKLFAEYAALIAESNKVRDSIIGLDVPGKTVAIGEFGKIYKAVKEISPEVFDYVNTNESMKETLDKTFKLSDNLSHLAKRLRVLPGSIQRISESFGKKITVDNDTIVKVLADNIEKFS